MFMKLPSLHRGKKEGIPPMPARDVHGMIPADRVASLSSQGMSEPEIIRTLRAEGYSPIEVDAAMKEALRSAVRPSAPRMAPAPVPTRGFGPPPESMGRGRRMLFGYEDMPRPAARMPEPPFVEEEGQPNELELTGFPGSQPRRPARPLPFEEEEIEEIEPIAGPRPQPSKEERMKSRREFEEITESVVEEKLGGFERRIDDMGDRIKELTVRVNNLQQALDRVQGERRGDITEITEKIETYKQGMSEVSSRMEGVERTMKDSMTPMMQSLRSLSDAIKSFKETRR